MMMMMYTRTENSTQRDKKQAEEQ